MRKLSIALAALFLIHIGGSAPQGSGQGKQKSSEFRNSAVSKSLSAVATPQSAGDQIVKLIARKSSKPAIPDSSPEVAARTGSSKRVAAVNKDSVPPPPIPRTSVAQIREEIEKILELNKKIKSVQGGRSGQLQRVQEQARIHQKILNDLETSQRSAIEQKNPTKAAVLAQEKLRIIHEETRRNAQMVSELETIPNKSTAPATPKVKTNAS